MGEIYGSWRHAPVAISTFRSQLKLTKSSLQLTWKVILKMEDILHRKADIHEAFKGALEALERASDLLDDPMYDITKGRFDPRSHRWRESFRMIWSKDVVRDISDQIVAQHVAMN